VPREEPFLRERLWAHDPELAPGVTARTELDDAGRPARTVYSGVEDVSEPIEERYGYDDAGRIVTIDEPDELGDAFEPGWREETGGRLRVEHASEGPLRILGPDDDLVWERVEEPWPELLASAARSVADRAIALVAARCREEAIAPETEVFGLMLTYVDQGPLHFDLGFGLEHDRRAWLRAGLDSDELASRLWYLDDSWFGEGEGGGLSHLEGELPGDDLGERLLRQAAIEQRADPYRVVLNAIAAELARRDWSELISLTEDFVVFIAEHDEGYRCKADSVRAANPPERVAAWDAAWPPGVSRGEDEPAC